MQFVERRWTFLVVAPFLLLTTDYVVVLSGASHCLLLPALAVWLYAVSRTYSSAIGPSLRRLAWALVYAVMSLSVIFLLQLVVEVHITCGTYKTQRFRIGAAAMLDYARARISDQRIQRRDLDAPRSDVVSLPANSRGCLGAAVSLGSE